MTEKTPPQIIGYAEIVAAFADARLGVPEARGEGALAAFRASVSRFSNGEAHTARRAATIAELAAVPVAELRGRTYDRVSASLRAFAARAAEPRGAAGAPVVERRGASGGWVDLMPVLRTGPVAVLAEALGVPDGDAVAARVAEIAPAYPSGAGADAVATADRAVAELAELIGRARLATVGCLLVQACDATAGLVANTLARVLSMPPSDRPPVDAALRATLRLDPPVRRTARVARAPLTVAGRPVAPGATVVLDIAAADRDDTADPLAFGSGPRSCPGRDTAFALATGAAEAAWHTTLVDIAYGPPGNLRIPTRLEVTHAQPT